MYIFQSTLQQDDEEPAAAAPPVDAPAAAPAAPAAALADDDAPAAAEAAAAALMPPPVHATEALERSRAAGKLPAGWTEHISKQTGKVYYFNSALNKNQWERP